MNTPSIFKPERIRMVFFASLLFMLSLLLAPPTPSASAMEIVPPDNGDEMVISEEEQKCSDDLSQKKMNVCMCGEGTGLKFDPDAKECVPKKPRLCEEGYVLTTEDGCLPESEVMCANGISVRGKCKYRVVVVCHRKDLEGAGNLFKARYSSTTHRKHAGHEHDRIAETPAELDAVTAYCQAPIECPASDFNIDGVCIDKEKHCVATLDQVYDPETDSCIDEEGTQEEDPADDSDQDEEDEGEDEGGSEDEDEDVNPDDPDNGEDGDTDESNEEQDQDASDDSDDDQNEDEEATDDDSDSTDESEEDEEENNGSNENEDEASQGDDEGQENNEEEASEEDESTDESDDESEEEDQPSSNHQNQNTPVYYRGISAPRRSSGGGGSSHQVTSFQNDRPDSAVENKNEPSSPSTQEESVESLNPAADEQAEKGPDEEDQKPLFSCDNPDELNDTSATISFNDIEAYSSDDETVDFRYFISCVLNGHKNNGQKADVKPDPSDSEDDPSLNFVEASHFMKMLQRALLREELKARNFMQTDKMTSAAYIHIALQSGHISSWEHEVGDIITIEEAENLTAKVLSYLEEDVEQVEFVTDAPLKSVPLTREEALKNLFNIGTNAGGDATEE